ncbi:MAG: hypothetical protein FWC70_10355 [Defluviitaleaceae bacterium]|nr:hypothetical protein [Defluviitaleaceae bacterium]
MKNKLTSARFVIYDENCEIKWEDIPESDRNKLADIWTLTAMTAAGYFSDD